MKRFTVRPHEVNEGWIVYDEQFNATSGRTYRTKTDAEAMAKLFNDKYPVKEKKGKKKDGVE